MPPPGTGAYTLSADGPLLALRDVPAAYGEFTVLRGVYWTLPSNTHCCIAGPNDAKQWLRALDNIKQHCDTQLIFVSHSAG